MPLRRAYPAVLIAVALAAAGCDQVDDEAEDEPVATAPPAPAVVAQAAGPAVRQGASRGMQAVAIVDAQGFGAPMTAATAEIPAGWRSQGGVNWNRGTHCIANQLRFEWMAAPPDGGQAFEVMHGFNWQVQGRHVQMNPCPVLAIASTRDFLAAVVQQRRPGARLLGYRDRPDLAEKAAADAARRPAVPGLRLHHDGGEMLVAYAAEGGEVQERFGAVVTFSEVQGTVMGGTGMVIAHRRRGGAPDEALGQRIAASIKPEPQWLSTMQQAARDAEQRFSTAQRRQIDQWHAGEMARINAQGAADRAAIRAQTSRDIARIQADTDANTQATNDRIHRRTLESVGEYNTYRDSAGNTVRSSIHGGSRVLRNPDGSTFSTNDPSLRPPGSEELQRVR